MSPSANNKGFGVHSNGVEGLHGGTVQNVVIAGAGPAGLMLA